MNKQEWREPLKCTHIQRVPVDKEALIYWCIDCGAVSNDERKTWTRPRCHLLRESHLANS